jgi:hypothetical protein
VPIQVQAGKLVIGHAGLGNMKIFELFSSDNKNNKIDFDLADDVIYFMNNDPNFYRKQYFPFLTKFQNHCDQGKQVSPKAFLPIVKRASEEYQKRFPIQGIEEAINDGQLQEICEKLHSQELANYNKKEEEN